jgi:hypothetical protein
MIFIDIRKSDEVYSKRFDLSKNYSVYNIPMNMIRFNAENIIKHLHYVNEIYIVCESSKRSNFIKHKYFHEYPQIKVNEQLQFSKLHHGMNEVPLNALMNINVVGSNAFNYYSVMRIIQTIMGLLILSLGGYTYLQIRKKKVNSVPLIFLLLFGGMALINGLTSTCSISELLQDYLN